MKLIKKRKIEAYRQKYLPEYEARYAADPDGVLTWILGDLLSTDRGVAALRNSDRNEALRAKRSADMFRDWELSQIRRAYRHKQQRNR